MNKLILISAISFLLAGCSDPENATRVLQASGYKEITITGYQWLGCGRDDGVHTGFSAVGQSGERVDGVVCQG